MHVAIIGAGMAGLTCGETLAGLGHEVRLFDKGRGPGGRMATRRMEQDGHRLAFDHGAQYFTARDPRFAARVKRWEAEGAVARWPAAGPEAFVGTPAMNAPIRAMAAAQNVAFGSRIESVSRDGAGEGGGWRLAGEGAVPEGLPDTVFDAVVVAVPAEQAGPLLAPLAPDFAAQAHAVVSYPCWTLMAAFADPVPHNADTMRDAGAIGWAARNSAKPGRAQALECWVVQGAPGWSAEHLERSSEDIIQLLLAELAEQVGALPPVAAATAHRWRYAMVPRGGPGALWDADHCIGACGDWVLGPRVESAYLSGLALAERIGRA